MSGPTRFRLPILFFSPLTVSLDQNINHSRPNVRAMQWFANFAVDEASKSQHVFPSESELDTQLIYNYCPQFSIGYSSFDQLYFFHEESISSQ